MGTFRCRSGLWVLILVVVLLGLCEIGSVCAQSRRPKNVQVAVRAKGSGTPLLLEAGWRELVHRQQFYFWKNFKNNRLKHIISKSQLQAAAATPASVSPPSTPPTAIAVVSPPSTPPTTIAVTAPIDPPESSIAVTSSTTATVQELSSGEDR